MRAASLTAALLWSVSDVVRPLVCTVDLLSSDTADTLVSRCVDIVVTLSVSVSDVSPPLGSTELVMSRDDGDSL